MELGLFLAQVPTGFYMSAAKAVPVVLVLLVWARAMTWLDKDSEAAHLSRAVVNLAVLAAGVLSFLLFFALSVNFWVGLAILIVVNLAAFGGYLGVRGQKVGLGDLKGDFIVWVKGLAGKKKEVKAAAGQVLLLDKAGNGVEAPNDEDPSRPAYDAVQQILTDQLRRGAERIDVVPGEGSARMSFAVDGFTYTGTALDLVATSGGVTLLKSLAGMDVNERRKPQRGVVKVTLDGKRYELQLNTSGSVAGESLSIRLDFKTRHALKLEQLGMGESQLALVRQSIEENRGIVLVAAPPDQGLTSMLYALVRGHDAFLQHIISVEREIDTTLDGVTQDKLSRAATVAEEAERLAWVTSQQPDVLMVPQVQGSQGARELIAFAGEGHRAYVGMRAANTFGAIVQWCKLVGDHALAGKNLELVICGRVVRKLCQACKVAYTPDPEMLRKLNMRPEAVKQLYQARTEPIRDERGNPVPCEFCHDLRFVGRTGFYEIFKLTDEARQVIAAGANVNQLKAEFRKQRGHYLQEHALALVQRGESSVQEVLRVLNSK